METLSTVGEVMSRQLDLKNLILKVRFSIPHVSDYIERFYEKQVLLRGREFRQDPELTECLHKVGKWLEDPHGTDWLMLAGNVGDGKTSTLYALQDIIKHCGLPDPVERKRDGSPDEAFLYIRSASELISFFTQEPDRYERMKNCGLLAIDDFGVEPIEVQQFGNITSPLTELLYSRYRSQGLTIVTTNIPLGEIRPRYGSRLADRFNEMMTVVSFPENTFRKQNF